MSCKGPPAPSYIIWKPPVPPSNLPVDKSVPDSHVQTYIQFAVSPYTNFFSCGFRGKQGRRFSSLAIFLNNMGKMLMFNHKVHKEIKSNTKAFGDVLMKLNHEDSKAGRNTKEEDIEWTTLEGSSRQPPTVNRQLYLNTKVWRNWMYRQCADNPAPFAALLPGAFAWNLNRRKRKGFRRGHGGVEWCDDSDHQQETSEVFFIR